ncbi:hypothetical protein [Bacillus sp. 03113]|uniref:hypothetical protein n=1 Tax=Bacillus sp. 03113 TaxID=2578211 RepID=UPI00114217C6|nr:hypothetical protein [Bacillus sp. 03113]
MKWLAVLGITTWAVVLTFYEWPKMNPNQKKEKVTFVTLTTLGWLLAVLLLFFPNMPGPTQLLDYIFKPLSKLLEEK